MGRTNPNPNPTNPAVKFINWTGDGNFRFYEPATKNEGVFDLPFTFLVLDQLNTIAGFSDDDNSGFWANEVRDIRSDMLTVRTKNGVRKTALYADLTDVMAAGAKFAKSIYIAYYDDDKNLTIGNLKATGSFLGEWFDFGKANELYEIAVEVAGAEPAKKGKTEYFTPVLKARSISTETDDLAGDLQKQVQKYLNDYLLKPVEEETQNDNTNDFDEPKAKAAAGFSEGQIDSAGVPEEEEPDIPF